MAKLASLVVDLQLQSAQLRQGLDEANRKLEVFAKQAERTSNFLEGVFTLDALQEGAAAFRDWILAGAESVEAMQNMAKAAGTPVEEFSKLAYAAERFGFESDNLAESFGQLAEYMAEAKKGSLEHAALFDGLGISVSDAAGNLRSTGDVFKDLAQRFSETQDGAAKTALAVKFFGEEGIKLIPTLNQGKAGLTALGDEATNTGKVITEKGAASAAQFNAALDRLHKAGEGLAASVAQDLAPSVMALADHFTKGKDSAGSFDAIAKALAGTMRVLASAGVLAAGGVEIVGKTLAGVGSAWANGLMGDGVAARESLSAMMESLRKVGQEENAKLDAIWKKDGPGAAMEADAAKAKPSADALIKAIEAQKAAAEKAAEAQKKRAAAAQKAAEDEAKAQEEHWKSALDLDRKLESITRAAAKRRAEAAGALPTDGFSDMEAALAAMEAAQKAAATARNKAASSERGGDAIGADIATREADEFDAMAERAGSAADAFHDMAKTAEEKAAEAFDAQIAAVAALEQTFDGIEQEVAARRAAQAAALDPGHDVTAGFTTFNAALDAMAEALKREATLRSEAAALERAGKLGEARQALLAAEATKALAETASAAAESLAEMDQARAGVPGELGGMMVSGVGSTTSAMMQGAQTGAAAGPWGAIIGAGVGLLSQSEAFQGALETVEEIFQELADAIGKLIEPLLPLLTIVGEVTSGLGSLLGALSPIVEFIARPLFEVFKAFSLVTLNIIRFVGEIINSIARVVGGKGFDMSGISDAIERLEDSSYDAAKEQDKVAETAREAAGALNAPSWWKDANARFNAAEQGRTGGSNGGGGAPPAVNDYSQWTIEVNGVTDPAEVARQMEEKIAERKNRRNGSRGGSRDDWMEP